MASFINAESKSESDYKAGDLTEEIFHSTEQGRAASQVIDTLEPASGSGDKSSSLPDTELPDTGPWQRVFDTLLSLCESVQTVMTRLWGSIISIFYNGMNPRGASIENLKIINEDETPRTEQEELEQKPAAEVAALKVEAEEAQADAQVEADKAEADKAEADKVAAARAEVEAKEKETAARAEVEAKEKETAAKAEAAKAEAEAATGRVVDHIDGILGPLMDLMQESGATSLKYLHTFGEILDAAATIELSETDKALIADDLLSTEIDSYCCSAYNKLPDPIKKELKAVLEDRGFMIERIGSASKINWKDLKITAAIDQMLEADAPEDYDAYEDTARLNENQHDLADETSSGDEKTLNPMQGQGGVEGDVESNLGADSLVAQDRSTDKLGMGKEMDSESSNTPTSEQDETNEGERVGDTFSPLPGK